jgi:hypothetical protein
MLLPLRTSRMSWPQLIDPPLNAGEQSARHRNLGQLKHHVAAVAHDPGADLHQLFMRYFASDRPRIPVLSSHLPVAPAGACAGNRSPEEHRMSRDQVARRCRRLLERLSQPSSAAGLAALLALLVPQLADHAPAIVDLTLTVIAISAAIVAMVRCECRDCNGR